MQSGNHVGKEVGYKSIYQLVKEVCKKVASNWRRYYAKKYIVTKQKSLLEMLQGTRQ